MRASLIVLFVILVSPARARADDVGVVITGEVTLQPQILSAVSDWLQKHEHGVAATALEPDAINALIDCFVIEDQACARKVIEERGKVATVLFVRVDSAAGPAGTHDVSLTGYWFAKGQPTISEKRTCERCADAQLRGAADDLMATLSRSNTNESGHVKVTSTPPGATVTLDGKPAGATPLEADVVPGEHQLELSYGERTAQRAVTVRRGQTTAVEVSLPAPPPPAPSHLVGNLVIGGGVALLVVGGIVYAQFEDADPNRRPEPRTLNDTHGLGLGLGIAGFAAVGAGVYLWLHPGATAAPVAALVPGGAAVGWAGAF